MTLEIRTLRSHDDFCSVWSLEQEIWGGHGADDAVPPLMLGVASKIGGLVIGAFEGGRLVGVSFALPGVENGRPYQWSHMLGVAADRTGAGIGRQLKLEQRRQVMAAGLDLIKWTYDPLQALNAHFNVETLGAVAREYHLDVYPGSTSSLHAGTATDRLIAEWWIRSERVEAALCRSGHGTTADRAGALTRALVPVNTVRDAGPWLAPAAHDLSIDAPRVGIVIPTGFTGMQQQDLPLAREWRGATREMFTAFLERGYVVSDFVLDRASRRGTYILARD